MLMNMGDHILIEDDTSAHKSKIASAWRDGHHLDKLEWPAQPPDFNPIENIWTQVKNRVQNKKGSINFIEALKVAIGDTHLMR